MYTIVTEPIEHRRFHLRIPWPTSTRFLCK